MIKKMLVIFVIFGCTLLFVNCDKLQRNTADNSDLAKVFSDSRPTHPLAGPIPQIANTGGAGDGSVFEGKVHYYALQPQACGLKDQLVRAEIVQSAAGYRLVKDNCRTSDLVIEEPKIELKSLDSKILVFEGLIFERFDIIPELKIFPGDRIVAFCKGFWTSHGMSSIADGIVRSARKSEVTTAENVIEVFTYGPRPEHEAFNPAYIFHYKGGARWDILNSRYTARWIQKHKGAELDTEAQKAPFMSLGVLKAEYYETSAAGVVLNGVIRVPDSTKKKSPQQQQPTFNVYSRCVDNR